MVALGAIACTSPRDTEIKVLAKLGHEITVSVTAALLDINDPRLAPLNLDGHLAAPTLWSLLILVRFEPGGVDSGLPSNDLLTKRREGWA